MHNLRSTPIASACLLAVFSTCCHFYSGSSVPLYMMGIIPVLLFIGLNLPMFEARPMGWWSFFSVATGSILAVYCLSSLPEGDPTWYYKVFVERAYFNLEANFHNTKSGFCLFIYFYMCFRVPQQVFKGRYGEAKHMVWWMLCADSVVIFTQPNFNLRDFCTDAWSTSLSSALHAPLFNMLSIEVLWMITMLGLYFKLSLEHKAELEAIKNGLKYENSKGFIFSTTFWGLVQLLIILGRLACFYV